MDAATAAALGQPELEGTEIYQPSNLEALRRAQEVEGGGSVAISFRGLSLASRRPLRDAEVENQADTIGTMLSKIVFGPWRFVSRIGGNLLYGAPPREHLESTIFRDVTGIIKAGRLTLVMGPSGHGTSFLKAIAGKFSAGGASASDDLVLRGDLRYNGLAVRELRNIAQWASFFGESDAHQAMLTARETLEFAFKCRKLPRYRDSIRRNRDVSGEAAAARLLALQDFEMKYTLACLGLDRCAEVVVGDDTTKGISGGERRRVTIGEMLMTGAPIMCYDEFSTGLDSAATYDITQFFHNIAHTLGTTIVVTCFQPSPEVIDVFDDVIVLAEGQMMYHGPREEMKPYFEGLGFRCPPETDLGDFIIKLCTRNGLEFQLDPTQLQAAGLPAPPTTPAEFSQRWTGSKPFQNELQELEHASAPTTLFNYDNMPQNTFFESLVLLTKWKMALKLHGKVPPIAEIMSRLIAGVFMGTFFYNLKFDDWRLKALFFWWVPQSLATRQIPTMFFMFQQKPTIYKHLEAAFYAGPVFTIAHCITEIPFVALDAASFGAILYWMCGLAPQADSFLIFVVVCTAFGICMNSLTTLIAFAVPKKETAVGVAALVFILFVVSSGAMSVESRIPILFQWLGWINPLAYAYRALMVNEYKSGDYEVNPCQIEISGAKFLLPVTCSEHFLSLREVDSQQHWIRASLEACSWLTIILLCVMAYVIKNVRFGDQKQTTMKRIPSPDTRSTRDPNVVTVSPKTLAIRNLWYSIPINNEPIDFLKDVSFWALPGRITALMGSSGAGKTTLLDVLAGRKTGGVIKGEICVNGEPKIQNEYIRYVGYVEQFGVHAHTATVEESLRFSATLRLPPSTTEDQRESFIEDILKLLELGGIRNALSGTLSVQQSKLLTLGVELIANPSIIFCDEPASGLEERDAEFVMRILQNIARSGRTVICTLHQPSIATFNFIDDLLLLKRGGQVTYFGELGRGASKMISYFEAIPGIAKCPDGYNPATWVLEVIGAGTSSRRGETKKHDYADIYENSDLHDKAMDRLRNEFIATYSSLDSPRLLALRQREMVESQFTTSSWVQFQTLLHRNFCTYWRSPEFSLGRILFIAILACFFENGPLRTMADVEGRIVNIFFFFSVFTLCNLLTLVPFILSQQALYLRERISNMYSDWVFHLTEFLVEMTFVLVQTVVVLFIVESLTSWNETTSALTYFFTMTFALFLLTSSVGLFFTKISNGSHATSFASLGMQLSLLFSGVFFRKKELPWLYLPFYHISFHKFGLEGLMTTQFVDLDTKICVPSGTPATSGTLNGFPICTSDGSNDLAKVTGIQQKISAVVLEDFFKDFHYENRYLDLMVIFLWIISLCIANVMVKRRE